MAAENATSKCGNVAARSVAARPVTRRSRTSGHPQRETRGASEEITSRESCECRGINQLISRLTNRISNSGQSATSAQEENMRPAWAPQNKLGGQLLNLTLYILGPLDLWLTLRAAATDMPNRPIPTQSTTECSAPGLLDRASGPRGNPIRVWRRRGGGGGGAAMPSRETLDAASPSHSPSSSAVGLTAAVELAPLAVFAMAVLDCSPLLDS